MLVFSALGGGEFKQTAAMCIFVCVMSVCDGRAAMTTNESIIPHWHLAETDVVWI